MRPVAPIAIGLAMAASVACAETAKPVPAGVEQCMEQTRAANAACIDPANNTPNLVACFEAAAAAQVACLKRASDEVPTQSVQPSAPPSAWVVSETASPLDYSPMVTAVAASQDAVSGAPVRLAVRCREKRTELRLRTDGGLRPLRAGELQVEVQIDAEPALRAPWSVSTDGRTAAFTGDAARLLRAIPDQARVAITVFDGRETVAQTTFQLSGMDAMRQRISAACGWEPQPSPQERIQPHTRAPLRR